MSQLALMAEPEAHADTDSHVIEHETAVEVVSAPVTTSWRERLIAFYSVYNSQKLADVDRLLESYSGKVSYLHVFIL